MRYRLLATFITVFFIINSTLSQNTFTSPAIDLFEHGGSSPNAAGLGKYFDYPVNMSTGLPNIEVPLFTIKTGNITLPISIKYHAGGVRVNESATWVGMGWSLDAGGVVNKRVNGLDDFYPNDNTNSGSTYLTPDFSAYSSYFTSVTDAIESAGLTSHSASYPYDVQHFLGRIPQGKIDGEADEYLYSMPGGGGKFFYNQHLSEYQNDKINGWKVTNGNGWEILANNGIHYAFGKVEKYINPLVYHPQQFITPSSTYIPTSWFLSNIDDYLTNKSISIYYDEQWESTNPGFDMSMDFSLATNSYHGENFQDNLRVGTEVSPTRIDFDQGSVWFIKDTVNRLDGGIKALKEIQLKNNSNQIIKRFLFNYFYKTADTATHIYVSVPNPSQLFYQLFLQSIQEISIDASGDTTKNAPYVFTYNFDHQLPCRLSYAQDLWGFYNGKKSNATLIPNDQLVANGINYTGANRDIDTIYTKTGTIKELQYPTGGKAIFDFENNRVPFGSLIGGLRIKRIINYDSVTSKSLITEYSYEAGNQQFQPNNSYTYFLISGGVGQTTSTSAILRVEGQSIFPLFCSQGSPILYSSVTQKQRAGGSSEELISNHHFLDLGPMPNSQNYSGGIPHNKYVFFDNFSGLEYETQLFKKKADGSIALIQKDSTELAPLNNLQNYFWNVQGAWSFPGTGQWIVFPYNDPYNSGASQPLNVDLNVNAYKMLQDQAVPKQKSQITYDGTQVLKTQTFYEYDVTNGNNKVVKTLTSQGDTLIRLTKFVSDYNVMSSPSGWNSGLAEMYNANITAAPVEILSYIKAKNQNDSLLLAGSLYQYEGLQIKKIFKLNSVSPLSGFQVSYNNSSGFYYDSHYTLFQEVTVRDYYNNPLTVEQNAKKESYIWDYGNSTAVALIKNASFSDVAYTSFESNGTGNWSGINSSYIQNSGGITGRKYYNQTGFSISKTGLLASNHYILSYWSKNGSYSVTGTESGYPKTLNSLTIGLNVWTLYEHLVSGQTTITITGSGAIDEVRLYPKGSLMATNTFEPMVGISSQCDASNRISRYEYDSFGRLIFIRDQNQNILKKLCYNYAGQTETCLIAYKNTTQTQNFTRNNCGSNYTGSTVGYNVAAGVYISYQSVDVANQLALNDISINGQAYANSHGTCTPNCNSSTCAGEGYKCINGVCEQGILVATSCSYDDLQGNWTNTYHYEWSDNSWSADYIRYQADTSWCE